MKKFTFILLAFTLLPAITFGQIKVNTAGKAFFGSGSTTTSYGAINLTVEGNTNGISFRGVGTNRYNIFKYNDNGVNNNDHLFISPSGSTSKGMKMGPSGGIAMSNYNTYSCWTTPVLTMTSKETALIEAHGTHTFSGAEMIKSIAYSSSIYTYVGNLKTTSTERTFYVKADGTVYAKNGYLQSSDAAFKEDVKPLENSLDKISALSAVSYYYKDYAENTVKSLSNFNAEALKNHINKDSTLVEPEIRKEDIETMKSEAYRKRLGLIAQEVEKIVPEVVRTMEDGKKGIMYSDLVSLLIEGVKELNTKVNQQETYIDELENRLDKIESLLSHVNINTLEEVTPTNLSPTQKSIASLSQNKPNPFNQETEINYITPECTSAYIGIYNLNGTQLKKYPLESNSQGSIFISASEFASGMYIYSLIIDNKEMDSKKMILTD